ncbi:MAG TPA: diguanylate cyclase, partial [Magnetospirillaceae bacterium]|nr:diguanylate cyclase [Magnetospirillaceae bacterium]
DLARERPDVAARLLLRSLAMISGRLRATHKLISENAPWVRELHRQAYEDPGTGLWAKSFLDEELPRRLVTPTALVLVKPDRFKVLVDSRGHAAGDEAMARIAAVLQSAVRALGRGWAIRVRGNETAIVAPLCPRETAAELARSVAEGIADLEPVPAICGAPFFPFSAAIVHAVWPLDEKDWGVLFSRSQGALMAAWGAGGARVVSVSMAGGESA